MDAPAAEKKMEDEADFPSNKQLGEFGKFSGSVAQKKAYFESQYKNIAAGKPKQEDIKKKTVILEGRTQSDSFPGLNVDKSTVQKCAIAVELENELQNSGCEFSTVENNNVADEIKERIDPLPVTENARDESCFKPQKVESETSLKSQRVSDSTSVMKKTPTSSATPKTSKSALTSKKPTGVERRVAPTSLHMSLNLETTNSEGDMRKSLIMERMGDKDIVKRAFLAFKTFKPSADSEIPGKTAKNTKTSSVGTPQKKIEGGNRVAKKASPLSSQTGPGKSRNATRVPNTVGSNKSHDMANERNKVSKKVEDKVNGKAAERTQVQHKEKKEAEIKRQKPKQSQELLHKKNSSNKGVST